MDRPVWSWHSYCYAPPLIGGALSDHAVWRLRSVAYIGPKSRTERHRKTKIGTEVAHVPRDADTAFKVKRSRSPGRFTHRGVNASGSCSGQRGNVLTVGTYCCYVAVGLAARGASVPTEGRRGAGAYRSGTCTACFFMLTEHKSCTVLRTPVRFDRLLIVSYFVKLFLLIHSSHKRHFSNRFNFEMTPYRPANRPYPDSQNF